MTFSGERDHDDVANYFFGLSPLHKILDLIRRDRKERGDEKADKVLMYDPNTGVTKYVPEGTSIVGNDQPQPPWAVAEVNLDSKLYGRWMASVRERLPKNIRWGDDINAMVSVTGKDTVKVKWRATTPAGIAYLNSLGSTLMNPELPVADPTLPAASTDSEVECAYCGHTKNCHVFDPEYSAKGFCGKAVCHCKGFVEKLKQIKGHSIDAEIVKE